MTLHKFTNSLSKDKKFHLAIELLKHAIPIWESYTVGNKITYRDSVAGLKHTVEIDLLRDTIEAIEQKLKSDVQIFQSDWKIKNLHTQFIDPIVAIQDDDWQLPDAVLKTFYSVYNLIEAFTENEETVFGDSTIYVSINQAIDALESSRIITMEEINNILNSNKP
jgi:hypothetical protein